ncbi:acylphosphatase [Acinetobacter sp. Marseille-Q1618]|uniref:acylphosphatase n=1 Tax=Acinetobacter sp. Marseille-Q1618 TaxID=2697502 RepID=UPI001570F4F7|nr:acylphosphatase [Acinetobacter sp. Marseille-Q1618]
MKAVKLIIQGKVQDVGYRRWFEKEANILNLKGYVMNLPSGEVEAVVLGNEQDILEIIRHSYVGPLRSQVSSIEQIALPDLPNYHEFTMIR